MLLRCSIEREMYKTKNLIVDFANYFKDNLLGLFIPKYRTHNTHYRFTMIFILLQIIIQTSTLYKQQYIEDILEYVSIYNLLKNIINGRGFSKISILEIVLWFAVCIILNTGVVIGIITLNEMLEDIGHLNAFSPIEYVEGDESTTLKDLDKKLRTKILINKDLRIQILRTASNLILSQYENHKHTVLLVGPPGVGKTETARKIIKYCGGGYIVRLSVLLRLSPSLIHSLLQKIALKMKEEKFVVLFDDGETGLLERQMIYNSVQDKQTIKDQQLGRAIQVTITNLLSILGGTSGYYTLFTTNISDGEAFDTAYSRRFSDVLSFPLPDYNLRKMIIKRYVMKFPALRNMVFGVYKNDDFLNKVTDEMDGFSGRDIKILFDMLAQLSKYSKISPQILLNMIHNKRDLHKSQYIDGISEIHYAWIENNKQMNLNVNNLHESAQTLLSNE